MAQPGQAEAMFLYIPSSPWFYGKKGIDFVALGGNLFAISGFGGLNARTGGSEGKTREEWAQDYDLDYPNKVISFASMFNVKITPSCNYVHCNSITNKLSIMISTKMTIEITKITVITIRVTLRRSVKANM